MSLMGIMGSLRVSGFSFCEVIRGTLYLTHRICSGFTAFHGAFLRLYSGTRLQLSLTRCNFRCGTKHNQLSRLHFEWEKFAISIVVQCDSPARRICFSQTRDLHFYCEERMMRQDVQSATVSTAEHKVNRPLGDIDLPQ